MITTLTGKNTWALSQKLKELKEQWNQQNPGMSIEQFEASAIGDGNSFLLDLQTPNLFSAKRMVVLKYLSENKQLAEEIDQQVDKIPDDIRLIIFDPNLDLRTKLAKTLRSKTDLIQKDEMDTFALRRWLGDEIKKRQLKISSAAQNNLLDRVGSQARLDQELTKLQNVDGEVTIETIDQLVAPTLEDNVFNFLEAFISGHKETAISYLKDFETSKMEASYLLNMMIWQLNILSVAIMTSQPIAEVARQTGLNVRSLDKARNLKNKISGINLAKLIHDTASVDAHFHEGQPWRQIEMLVFNWNVVL